MSAKTTSTAFAAVLLLAAVPLAGCGVAPWEVAESATPRPSTSSSATPAASDVPTPVPNDLSTGSTARTLTSGSVSANVNYWSTLNLAEWTPAALKPLSVSLVTTTQPDDGHKVYLQRASVTAVPYDESGALGALEPQTDTASVSPGYLVLDPYSYSQTFTVGPVPEEATYVTLDVTYDFLVQTTPTSTEYAKQTMSDRITVAIARG